MKFLNSFLIAVYVVLILLLLTGKECRRDPQPPAPREEVTPEPEQPITPGETTEEDNRRAGQFQSGELQVTLLYDFYGDIDLHVITPGGVDINYAHTRDAQSTGELDHDEQNGGREGNAENISFSNPPDGTYKIFLHYYSGQVDSRNSSRETYICRVIVKKHGVSQTYPIPMRTPHGRSEIIEVTMP